MLQLRNEERILTRIYPCKVRFSCGSVVSPAMRFDPFLEGYELGRF